MVLIGDVINCIALIDKLLIFLINAIGLELILWTYAASRNTRPGRMFLALVFFVLLWIDCNATSLLAPEIFEAAPEISLWSMRAVFALMAVFFAVFYIAATNFPAKNYFDKTRRGKENLQVSAWTFFFTLSFTPFVVREAIIDPQRPLAVHFDLGPMFWIYAAFAVLTFFFSFTALSQSRRFADPANRNWINFIALGAGIFGGANILFNMLGLIFSKAWSYAGIVFLFADFIVVFLLGGLVYRAAREKFFGIKVVLVEIFVGLMGAVLAVLPFFIVVLWQQILMVMLFILFCVFGYLLIDGVINEYREKELLEQKVSERTKELEVAKRNLEEMNSALEIRVKARTRELEKLNRTLEEKIAARTNDLEAKINDLEKFQRITVGRELKMIELKKEIEYLRATINNMGSAETSIK